MPTATVGAVHLRAEHVDRAVKGFALQSYKLKQICMIESSSSWKETYKIETAADLEAGAGTAVKGIPRGAKFPYGEVSWTDATKRHEKYGIEGKIDWEDTVTSEIDVIARTLLRIGRAVAKAVDDEIYTQISDNAGQTVAAPHEWNAVTLSDRDPIQDILDAQALISIQNYDPYSNTYLLLHPTDYKNLLGNANVRNAGQFWTDSVTKNGVVGRICGLTVVVSNSITSSDKQAIVIIAKQAATWKSAHALTTHTDIHPGIDWQVRAWEVGVTQVTNPNAICTITSIRV